MSTPNYNETTVTGQAWQRCHQVVIENPRAGQQVVRFEEERVLSMDGGAEIKTPAGGMSVVFDPAKEIPLRNPMTGELTGQTTTYGAAYALLYSAYLAAAIERDAANTPPVIEEPTGA
jgi:hypothetical protein